MPSESDAAAILTAIAGLRRASTLAGPATSSLPTGLAALDRALGGGLPAGKTTEIVSQRGERMSLLMSLAAGVTGRGGLLAWIDPGAFLEVRAAERSGIALERVLWVRPPNVAQAVRSVDLVLGSDGFMLAILDLASLPAAAWRGVNQAAQAESPRSAKAGFRLDVPAWNRLARRAEAQGTALVVCGDRPLVGAAAALILHTRLALPTWQDGGLAGAALEVSVAHRKGAPAGFSERISLSLAEARDV